MAGSWPRKSFFSLAAANPDLAVSAVLLRGDPADALREYAARAGCHLLVIGAKGHGSSNSFLGSVARRLAGGAGLPVLVIDDPAGGRKSPATSVTEVAV